MASAFMTVRLPFCRGVKVEVLSVMYTGPLGDMTSTLYSLPSSLSSTIVSGGKRLDEVTSTVGNRGA